MNTSDYMLQTNVKYITSSFKAGPSLENTYSSFNKLLKGVLCEGFNINTVKNVEVLDDFYLKIFLNKNHGFVENQVVTLSGADTPLVNKEYRVFASNEDYILCKYPSDLLITSVAGTKIEIKTSPLGFSIAYENLSKTHMCFKNKSKQSSVILKVLDELPPGYNPSWGKFARVTFGTTIGSDGEFINNIKAPKDPLYPDAEKTGNGVKTVSGIYGYAKWDYMFSPDAYNRESTSLSANSNSPRMWQIIGDGDTFYLYINVDGTFLYNVVSFGLFNSENKEETSNACLQARDGFRPANDTSKSFYIKNFNSFGTLGIAEGSFLLSDVFGGIGNTLMYRNGGLFFENSYKDRPEMLRNVTNLNPQSGVSVTSPIQIVEDVSGIVRGTHRGVYLAYGVSSLPTIGKVSPAGYLILNSKDYSSTYTSVFNTIYTLSDWDL